MSGISLNTVETHLLSNGSKSVKESMALINSMSMFVSPNDKPRFDNYMTAANRFLQLCSGFLDIMAKNNNFVIYTLLVEFVKKYPKTKQNLANPLELINAFTNFYRMQQKSKSYKPDKDLILKFIRDNKENIYNTVVVITNVLRAKALIKT